MTLIPQSLLRTPFTIVPDILFFKIRLNKVTITYSRQISIRFHNNAKGHAWVFSCLIRPRNPISSAPHQWLICVEQRVVNSGLLDCLLDLLHLLLSERLLDGIIIHLSLLLCILIRLHVCELIDTWSHLIYRLAGCLHLLLTKRLWIRLLLWELKQKKMIVRVDCFIKAVIVKVGNVTPQSDLAVKNLPYFSN